MKVDERELLSAALTGLLATKDDIENRIGEIRAKLNGTITAPGRRGPKPGFKKGPMSEAAKAKMRKAWARRKRMLAGRK